MNIWDKIQEIELIKGIAETLYMVFVSAIIAFFIGLVIGFVFVITGNKGIKSNVWVHKILGLIINIGRSFPFVILMIFLIPFTRSIVGKSWGPTAAIVPLTIGAIPFVARLIESYFKEIDSGVLESAICMGANMKQIAYHVYIKESLPALLRGFSLTFITLIGYSAMAGSIGGGGLGDIAIKWGYQRYDQTAMILSIVVIIVLVQSVQISFDAIANKINKAK